VAFSKILSVPQATYREILGPVVQCALEKVLKEEALSQ
jgi:hypothetical protein